MKILQFVKSRLTRLATVVAAMGNSFNGLCERVRVVSEVIFDMSLTSALAVRLQNKRKKKERKKEERKKKKRS